MSKKQDIMPRNDKGQYHGLSIFYRANGNVMYIQRYVNGIEHGISESYWFDSELKYKSYTNNNDGGHVYVELYIDSNRIIFNI